MSYYFIPTSMAAKGRRNREEERRVHRDVKKSESLLNIKGSICNPSSWEA